MLSYFVSSSVENTNYLQRFVAIQPLKEIGGQAL